MYLYDVTDNVNIDLWSSFQSFQWLLCLLLAVINGYHRVYNIDRWEVNMLSVILFLLLSIVYVYHRVYNLDGWEVTLFSVDVMSIAHDD